MSTKTEVENVRTTGPEKLLAAVLAVFILIGAIWGYGQIGKISGDTYAYEYGAMGGPQIQLSEADRTAIQEKKQADRAVHKADVRLRQAKERVTFRADTYRTELDAGQEAGAALAAYREARQELATARRDRRRAGARRDATLPAARQARVNHQAAFKEAEGRQQRDQRWVAVLRLLLVGSMLGLSYWGLTLTRRHRSRLMPLTLAWISASTLLAIWMAADYGSQAQVFREVGPLVISVIGILLTLLAFIALQRYLARRIPLRRVRKRECPFCGYPCPDGTHCEGCGRRVVAECSTCHQDRRVGTAHCANCGNP